MNLDALNLDALRPMLPLPLWQKLLALTAAVFLLIIGYVYFFWVPLQQDIERQKVLVGRERIELAKNQRLAKDLPRKRAEFEKLEKDLKVALNMLPKKSQIPDLLENVSWAGKDSGLEFSTFKPQSEVEKQIYAEVPVALDVTGTFKQLLTFLKRVGEMPRIVSVHGLTLKKGKDGEGLEIKGTVTTYRFVEVGEGSKKIAQKPRRK